MDNEMAEWRKETFNVKSSLRSRLRRKDVDIVPTIVEWVRKISKMTNKASLLFNRWLLYLCENDLDIPADLEAVTVYRQCFTMGPATTRKSVPFLRHVWNSEFGNFPLESRFVGDSSYILTAASRYQSSFLATLRTNFVNRQRTLIRHWLADNSRRAITRNVVREIQRRINQWPVESGRLVGIEAAALEDFTRSESARLGGACVTEEFLKENPNVVVKYYYHVLKYLDNSPSALGKRFTLAPVSGIRNHFITIDTAGIWPVMRLYGNVKMKEGDVWERREEIFQQIFTIDQRKNFDYGVATDGVSACLRYYRWKRDPPRESSTLPHRVIGIDPGVRNIAFTAEKNPRTGRVTTHRLTRGEYYAKSGILTAQRKAANWMKQIEGAQKEYAKVHVKTANSDNWVRFLENYVSVYHQLWNGKTGKKWGRSKLRVHGSKQRTIDTFVNKLLRDPEEQPGPKRPIVVAYGSGKFSASVPTTAVPRKLQQRLGRDNVCFVDEYNTSRVCHGCDSPLREMNRIDRRRRCVNAKCCAVVDRDLNAALNIARSLDDRPPALTKGLGNSFQKKLLAGLHPVRRSV